MTALLILAVISLIAAVASLIWPDYKLNIVATILLGVGMFLIAQGAV